ncbi:aminopeptidase N isoform X3 [Eurytemora carolleeae]|nr:aminopeptidase N isoform X3 [Eurytemora carolleeae]|eukprot:XP_023321016.1 aminopeptidase N-like isoform X3 [Eurytemora affinis]
MTGFYRSSYFDFALNQTKVVGSTQFQSIHAREAFPCFDEPDMKATFKVILGRQGNMITLSNMPKEKIDIVLGTEVDVYETSVKMSTYLLSFIICEFKSLYLQTDPFFPLRFNVWAQEDKLPQLKHAANIGKKAIPFFEDMFDLKYPLAKIDLVAIPDFKYGAMENWGILSYRDKFLFYDKTDSSELNKLEISMVVCHEIAHQWFGNLVTMRWWNDLWLNEGFGTYMAYVAVNSISPETKLLEQIAFIETKDIFVLDAVKSAKPLSAEVKNPEFEGMQPQLAMYKGCLLIRMMENFLTPEVFRQGLRNYFKGDSFLWVIPISYKSILENLSDTTVNFWLTESAATLPARNKELLFFNAGRMGYYRVSYSIELWDRVIENFSKLPNVVRAQLVDDALFLSRTNSMFYSQTFKLLNNLRTETDYVVLSAAENGLKFLMNMLVDDRRYDTFLDFIKTLVEKVYYEVRDSTSVRYQDVVKRSLVMKWACSLNINDCIARAEYMFKIWKQTEKNYELSVSPDDKEWVYCYGLKFGRSERDWDFIWKRTQETKNIREKSALYEALACTDSISLLDKYLDISIDPNSTIRKQDKRYVYSAIGKNNVNGAVRMLDWLDENWEQILKYYEGNFPYNAKFMIEPYSENACTQERFDKLNQFYNKNKAELGTSGQIVEEVLDKIKANLRWRKISYEDLFRDLERVVKETTAGNEVTTNSNEIDGIVVEEGPSDNEGSGTGNTETPTGNEESATGNGGSATGNDGSETGNEGLEAGNEVSGTDNEESGSGDDESETGIEGLATGNDGSETDNVGSETNNEGLATGNEGSGTDSEGSETGNEESETGNEGSATGNEESPTGNERSATGNDRSETDNQGSSTGNEGSGSNNDGSSTDNQGSSTDYEEQEVTTDKEVTEEETSDTEVTTDKEDLTDTEVTTNGGRKSGRRNSRRWRSMIHYLMRNGYPYQEAKAIVRDENRLKKILDNRF